MVSMVAPRRALVVPVVPHGNLRPRTVEVCESEEPNLPTLRERVGPGGTPRFQVSFVVGGGRLQPGRKRASVTFEDRAKAVRFMEGVRAAGEDWPRDREFLRLRARVAARAEARAHAHERKRPEPVRVDSASDGEDRRGPRSVDLDELAVAALAVLTRHGETEADAVRAALLRSIEDSTEAATVRNDLAEMRAIATDVRLAIAARPTQPVRLFDYGEAAGMLGIGEDWLRAQVTRRVVPHVRLGRAVRFSAANLTDIVESMTKASTEPQRFRSTRRTRL